MNFHYEESIPILKNINITIKEKERLAIVGYTGAGKSTFIKLLSRFYDPTKGSIEIDGSAYTISTKLVGNYNFTNILAAVASGVYFNVEPARIVEALANYKPSNNRSQFMEGRSNTLILDILLSRTLSLSLLFHAFCRSA